MGLRVKMEDCLCSDESTKGLMTFRALLLRFWALLLYSKWPTVLPVVGGEIRVPHSPALPYPPRFEVCGGTGWITSEAAGSELTLSRSPTLCRSGSVRAAHPRSQPEGSQDTRGLCRSRVERLCQQRSNTDRVQSPHAVSYSPLYNSKQRQTFSAHCSIPSKSCNFRAFSGKEQ